VPHLLPYIEQHRKRHKTDKNERLTNLVFPIIREILQDLETINSAESILEKRSDTNPKIDLRLQLLGVYQAKANGVKAGHLDSRQMIDLLPQRKTE
jgi:hypothetical protein